MKTFFLSIMLIFSIIGFSQTVSIGVFHDNTNSYYNTSSKEDIIEYYEEEFGFGNVIINDYGENFSTSQATINSNDIVILCFFLYQSIPISFEDKMVDFYNLNKHLVVSSEGAQYTNGTPMTSSLWNRITGHLITETFPAAYGTATPPRFHPSSGPGGLSPNDSLENSSTSYTSYGNVPPLNAIHQRTKDEPSCDNVEALDALYPSKISSSSGSIYITGEIYYPFFYVLGTTKDHAKAHAAMHHALITNNSVKVDNLNKWLNNSDSQKSFVLDESDINYVIPNIFSPNNDGINDTFSPSVVSKSKPVRISFKAFNRWGNEVYNTTNPDIKWAGKNIDGSSLNEGVFYYQIEATFSNNCPQYYQEITLKYQGNTTLTK